MKSLRLAIPVALAFAASSPGCATQVGTPPAPLSTFQVTVLSVNGKPLPTAANPLPSNSGTTTDTWAFTIQAVSPEGKPQDFNGYVGLQMEPGTVVGITGEGSADVSNILLEHGKASGAVQVLAVYGPARLWVEDLGYVPAAPGTVPQCSNGIDDNDNGLIDFPSDPGCYRADDDTEDGGTYASGVSDPVQYMLPTIMDVRGTDSAVTPYPNESVAIAATRPAQQLIVTGIATDGFFVTDVSLTATKALTNSLYAFNFMVPPDMAVCDQVTALAGTSTDFYGFTQLGAPTWTNNHVSTANCQVPEPFEIPPAWLDLVNLDKTPVAVHMFPYEASLVRVEGFQIAKYIGSGLAVGNHFAVGVSNCDFNGDGLIDYSEISPDCPPGMCEGDCATSCDASPDCSLWTDYSGRNQVKVSFPGTTDMIELNMGAAPQFDVLSNVGQVIPSVTGNLTEFSGGDLNWTILVRCPDDLVCPAAMGCTTQVNIPSNRACVLPPTQYDNDEGTN